jgi:hypothetical protein
VSTTKAIILFSFEVKRCCNVAINILAKRVPTHTNHALELMKAAKAPPFFVRKVATGIFEAVRLLAPLVLHINHAVQLVSTAEATATLTCEVVKRILFAALLLALRSASGSGADSTSRSRSTGSTGSTLGRLLLCRSGRACGSYFSPFARLSNAAAAASIVGSSKLNASFVIFRVASTCQRK